MSDLDLIITNVSVVVPGEAEPQPLDIGVKDGKIVRLEAGLSTDLADTVVDGGGKVAFPGVVDAHQHWGIYNPLAEDAAARAARRRRAASPRRSPTCAPGSTTSTRAATTATSSPRSSSLTEGQALIDYAYHLAPMSKRHIEEIPSLVGDHGVTSFKIFMFYGGHGLHGRSADQSSFLMTPEGERYDYAHFEFVMRGIQAAREKFPEIADQISLSLHCETAEIMTAYTKLVEEDGTPQRPAGLQRLAAAALRGPRGHHRVLPRARDRAADDQPAAPDLAQGGRGRAYAWRDAFPHIDFRREVTVGHLLADCDTAHGIGGKVNPPLRPREDVEALWAYVLDGTIDWVVSDHACCKDEQKFGEPTATTCSWPSRASAARSTCSPAWSPRALRRGLSFDRIAELTVTNPAARYGLGATKGAIAVGKDADIALVDTDHTWTVRAEDSESTQEYTPFEGFELTAKVTDTFVRGHQVMTAGVVSDEPVGRYLSRPTS